MALQVFQAFLKGNQQRSFWPGTLNLHPQKRKTCNFLLIWVPFRLNRSHELRVTLSCLPAWCHQLYACVRWFYMLHLVLWLFSSGPFSSVHLQVTNQGVVPLFGLSPRIWNLEGKEHFTPYPEALFLTKKTLLSHNLACDIDRNPTEHGRGY